ncbi:MAG: hypothetical protein VX498_03660 [Myxococcota bacterium]|nr:hypothetical protein [Myxococcota bacterium]
MPRRTIRLASGVALLALVSMLLGCPGESEEPACDELTPEALAEEVEASSTPLNERDPILVEQLSVAFVCDDFPDNGLGLGAECDTHSDCGHSEAICVKGIVPCERGRCTRGCRMDRECGIGDIDFDYPPEFVCVIAQDQLSVCLPSACIPRIPGWDETCGPLSGEAVNDLGVGKYCQSQADCDPYPGSVCPPPGSPEPYCSRTCETDTDCGENAACVCIDDHDCIEENFVCAPAVGCAEAVRHHHCRGEGIPPRDHEMACGGHD